FQKQEVLIRNRTHLQIHILQASMKRSLDEIDRMHREHEAFLRHELNNRITPILGYTEMLSATDDGSLGEKRLRWITTVHNSAQEISNLVDALKQLQDFEAGRSDLTKSPVDLDSLILRVIDDLKAAHQQADIRLEDALIHKEIQVDGNLMIGVFHNLIKNAIEHVADLPDEAEREVRVVLSNHANQAVIRIHNRGEPIPEEKLDSFFEKFNTSKKEKGGTGLGTTYAYLVTTAHGGKIEVASTPEEGTTLTVQLPLD
ncbi:MAG: HAMP domain-containing sensor histidine kinase, partial [bacterium]|nr:HAMP domain-containing sensor histidine kinase [bacterium]